MSRAAPAIPLFGDAYIADTRHLSLEEHGAYLQLLMIAWRTDDCSLPNDDKRIAQMLGITSGKWRKLKPTVMSFWTLEDGRWTQKRLKKERAFVKEKQDKNSQAAKARWSGQDSENKGSGECERISERNSERTSERNAPPPPPIKSSEAKASGGVPPADPLKQMFDLGVALLTETGVSQKDARSLLGKWRRDYGEAKVIQALIDCRAKAISNPIEWLTKRFVGAKYVSASGFEYRGDLEAIQRMAEKRADWNTYWQIEVDKKAAANG